MPEKFSNKTNGVTPRRFMVLYNPRMSHAITRALGNDHWISDLQELKQLEKDKVYYQKRIEEDAARLTELQTNNENLEKFAREQYLMHKENEDVFIVIEE